jgi:hypothetical protein
MDNEIVDLKARIFCQQQTLPIVTYIQYELRAGTSHEVRIFMKMLYSGPCEWAEGLKFDPFYDDRNSIGIMMDVRWPKEIQNYDALIQWMQIHVPSQCIAIDSQEADVMWNKMTV